MLKKRRNFLEIKMFYVAYISISLYGNEKDVDWHMNTEVSIDLQRASQLLKLLGDPTRLKMMKLLKSHECCVCEFVEIFKMSQPAISQHLRKLRDIELVKEERRRQWVFFSINENHEDYPFVKSILEHLPEQNESIAELEALGLRVCCE